MLTYINIFNIVTINIYVFLKKSVLESVSYAKFIPNLKSKYAL